MLGDILILQRRHILELCIGKMIALFTIAVSIVDRKGIFRVYIVVRKLVEHVRKEVRGFRGKLIFPVVVLSFLVKVLSYHGL